MRSALRPRTFVLFVGDICFFFISLWLSLVLRVSVPAGRLLLPPGWVIATHIRPFSLLFIAWVGVFFIAGLYEVRAIALARRALSSTLLIAQIINVALAGLFFFFIPIFGIEPKTLLFIYLIVSFPLILLWRAGIFPFLGFASSERVLVVGEGHNIDELASALGAISRGKTVVHQLRPSNGVLPDHIHQAVATYRPQFIITDLGNASVISAFPELYNLVSQGIRFLDAMTIYEEVFGRVPLGIAGEGWFIRTASRRAHLLYDPLKRIVDIILALIGGSLSLLLYPFIILAIKLDDGGPLFVQLDRVGKDNKTFTLLKFRSMTGNDNAAYGATGKSRLRITRVGNILRISRLDELPQFWNLLRGDLSFVGPRPEAPALVALYEKAIPHYALRHLIKPGLAGWAQLYHDNHPHHGTAVEATQEKLSYDLYYFKYRSLVLDIIITLKTIKKMLMRSGA